MTQRDWARHDAYTLGVFLNGKEVRRLTQRGRRLEDDSFLLLFNSFHEPVVFTLPPRRFGPRWELELSTSDLDAGETVFPARGLVPVEDRSVVVLRSG